MIDWLNHFFGADNTSGVAYGWWSGVAGSFLSTALMAVPVYLWHHNCHQRGCPRVGRHQTHTEDGTVLRTCRRHLPAGE